MFGGGASGVDISIDVSKSAQRVILSHHREETLNGFPENLSQCPDLVEVLADGMVEFKDGSTSSVDVILFCTGYNYSFPFLTPQCGITIENNFVNPLYNHIVNINHPTMFFIGVPFLTLVAITFELQVSQV